MGRPKKIEKLEFLDIAREILIEEGAVGAPKKIAKRAGISEKAVFDRCPTKADLLAAALAPPDLKATEIIAEASRTNTPPQSLQRDAERLLEYFRHAVPSLLPILGEPNARRQTLLNRLGENPALTLRNALQSSLLAEAKTGRISKIDAKAAASVIVFALHSLALFESIGLQSPEFTNLAIRTLIDVLWNGLRPKTEKEKPSRSKKRSTQAPPTKPSAQGRLI